MRLIDNKILNELKKGRATLAMLTETLEGNRDYIWQRLQVLIAEGKVKKVAKGLYERVER